MNNVARSQLRKLEKLNTRLIAVRWSKYLYEICFNINVICVFQRIMYTILLMECGKLKLEHVLDLSNVLMKKITLSLRASMGM